MSKRMLKKDLKNLEIILDDDGFVVWTRNQFGQRVWIVDGSLLRSKGIIHFSKHQEYHHITEFNQEENLVQLIQNPLIKLKKKPLKKKSYAKSR